MKVRQALVTVKTSGINQPKMATLPAYFLKYVDNMKLLISLFFCHWLADFTHLLRPYMLRAKSFGTPLVPILDHACVHGLLMLIAMIIYGVDPLVTVCLTVFQIATHFGIDVLKGKMNKWFPNVTDPTNVYHWYIFGFDQLLHSLVVIIMWKLSQ